jgi:hypothetical protein
MDPVITPFPEERNQSPGEYRIRRSVQRTYGIIAIVCAISAIVSFCYSIWSWYFAYSNYGPAAVWRWSELPFYTSLGLGAIALIATIYWLRSRALVVRTSDDALIVQRGRQQKRTQWGEIESIVAVSERTWSPFNAGRERFQFWIQQYSGKKQRFGTTLEDIQRLAATIKLQIYPLLLEKYRRQLAQNETIDLGAVQISRDGIGIKRRQIKWQELSGAELQGGKLVVHYRNTQRGMKVAIPSRRVKNMDLCIQIIEGIETT